MPFDAFDLALVAEIVFIVGIIFYVPYTEIDWEAYMDEVGGFLGGELDYTKLQGGTGPLVYPGGFVWLFSALYYVTRAGKDILLAQWIFAGVYWLTAAIVFGLYRRLRLPGKIVVPFFMLRRIRSLFVLRLFNDCWAMLFLYAAVMVFAGRRYWSVGCILFSTAVSIKMNVLLFAPGLLYVLLRCLPLWRVAICLFICAAWQLAAGYPFLIYDWQAYMWRAFELGRVFTHRWSVNFQFLPEDIFVKAELGHALLGATALAWLLVWRLRWRDRVYVVQKASPNAAASTERKHRASKKNVEGNAAAPSAPTTTDTRLRAGDDGSDDDEAAVSVILTLLESNLIGVAFARSMHYQFLTWFIHAVPAVMHYTRFPRLLNVGVFVAIRYAFDVYPPTPQSSAVLMSAMGLAVLGVVFFGKKKEEGHPALLPQPVATHHTEETVTRKRKQKKQVVE